MEGAEPNVMDEFTEIKLKQLDVICEKALKNGQYVLILDKTTNCTIYFEYKATQKEFQKEMVKVQVGLQDKKQACEPLRSGLIYSMRSGDRFVIYVDKLVPDFNVEYNFAPDHWPSTELFDFQAWRENDTYMKVVKESENHDVLLNKGKYSMHDNFQMIYLATFQGKEETKRILEGIPHSKKMAKYIVVDG